jgi:hypothetical protein
VFNNISEEGNFEKWLHSVSVFQKPLLINFLITLQRVPVFKSPVQFGFSALFKQTATATGCLLWQNQSNRIENVLISGATQTLIWTDCNCNQLPIVAKPKKNWTEP